MEKISFMLGKQWDHKPTNAENAIANSSHKVISDTIKFLSEHIVEGYSFRPGILEGGLKDENWTKQQLFALDFDSKDETEIILIEEAYKLYTNKGIVPCFMYTTFSNSSKIAKFRMVFCANEPITDVSLRDKLQATLMGLTNSCDIRCKDKARFFNGCISHKVLYPNYNARIDANWVINTYWKDTEQFTQYISTTKITNNSKLNNKKKASKYTQIDNLQNNIDVIENLQWKELKNRLGTTSYEYFNEINLAEYLGVSKEDFFCCILPDHDDTTPSAHIYVVDNIQYYKCFGCIDKKPLNIIDITCKISGCERKDAIEFLKKVYDIEYPYEYIENYCLNYKKYIELIDSDAFIEKYPNLNQILGKRKKDLIAILSYMANNVSLLHPLNNIPLFILSTNKLLEICNQKSKDYVSKTINLFCLLNLLCKPSIETVSDKVKTRAKKIQCEHSFKNYINFVQVVGTDEDSLLYSETLAKALVDNNFQISLLSREYVLTTCGKERADYIYPQYKKENKRDLITSSSSFIPKTSKKILNSINKKGYILESKLYSNKAMEKIWKVNMQNILDKHNLSRIRLNNALKGKYNIKCNGYPYIIIKM